MTTSTFDTDLIKFARHIGNIARRELANPQVAGRPVILCEEDSFYILYQGAVTRLKDIDLKTLDLFLKDIHGPYEHETSPDCENLTSSEFVAFARTARSLVNQTK